MSDLFGIGMSGLLANQRALSTVSHNIANVSTEGYSRQEVEFSARPPSLRSDLAFGNGTEISSVQRVYDSFLVAQMRSAASGASDVSIQLEFAARIDNLLAEPETGLSSQMQRLFNAFDDLANDPGSAAARQVVLDEAANLAASFNQTAGVLDSLQSDLNGRLAFSVDELNGLSVAIADINNDIVAAMGRSRDASPNDLLDERDRLVARMAELVDVRTVIEDSGAMNVSVGTGQTLVAGATALQLETRPGADDPSRIEVHYAGTAGSASIGNQLTGGEIGGLLAFRDSMLDPVRNALGRTAIALAETLNTQHRAGMDLDGRMGGDLFTFGGPVVFGDKSNTGSATLGATLADVGGLTAADYRIAFNAGAWSVTNTADGRVVSSSGSGSAADPLTFDGLEIVVTGTPADGDRFQLQPTRAAARTLSLALSSTRELAAALPVRGETALGNLGSGESSGLAVVDATDPALANRVRIEFIDANNFDVIDETAGTTLASGVAYSAGMEISYNGWSMTLNGLPQGGDRFTVTSNSGGYGDGGNALALTGLQGQGVLEGGRYTVGGSVGQMIAEVGSRTHQLEVASHAEGRRLSNAQQAIDRVSGVNLDEEASRLIQLQQAYEASARVIAVARELFDTLLGAVGR